MASFEFLAIILTGLGLAASIVYYASILNNANKTRELQLKAQEQATETRQTQLFMNIYNNHISESNFRALMEMIWEWEWDSFDDFIEKYSIPNNKDAHVQWGRYFASLEGLGILLKKGLIDPELVYDSHYLSVINLWEKFQPVIEEWRVRLNAPQLYEDPEYLYNEMVRMRTEKEHEAAKVTMTAIS